MSNELKLTLTLSSWGGVAHNDKDEDNLDLCAYYIEEFLQHNDFDIQLNKIEEIEQSNYPTTLSS